VKLPLLLQELSLTSSTAKTPVATASMLLSATGGCPALRRLKFCSRLPIDLKSVRTKGPGGQHAADHAVLSGCGVACLQPLPRRLASLHWTLPRTSSVAELVDLPALACLGIPRFLDVSRNRFSSLRRVLAAATA